MTGLRENLTNHPWLTVLIAGVLLVLTWWGILRGNGDRVIPSAYFYDLAEAKLYPAILDHLPPIEVNGHEAVRARVFACGSCEREEARFIGYLEKYTDDYKQAARLGQGISRETVETGHLVSEAGSLQWVAAGSDRGRALIDRPVNQCNNPSQLNECNP